MKFMKKEQITELQMREILANNLRYLRITSKMQLSQKALARYLALSVKTLRNYETGCSSMNAYYLYILSSYYGCTMEELLTKNLNEERV